MEYRLIMRFLMTLLITLSAFISFNCAATTLSPNQYAKPYPVNKNHLALDVGLGLGYAKQDISSPVDTYGYTLEGSNLEGGFSAQGFLQAGILNAISGEVGLVIRWWLHN